MKTFGPGSLDTVPTFLAYAEAILDLACRLPSFARGQRFAMSRSGAWRFKIPVIQRITLDALPLYLALAIWTALGTDTKHIRLRCVLYDEGRVAIPLLAVTAASASVGAIFFQLSTAPAGHHFISFTFAVVTILLSWSFIQFIFAFHYAHELVHSR